MTTTSLQRLRELCAAAPEKVSLRVCGGGESDSESFYAAACTAVPELLDEVERLTRERDSYASSDFERQLSEARAEVERLRAALREALSFVGASGYDVNASLGHLLELHELVGEP